MLLLQSQTLINILQIYGLFSLFATVFVAIFYIKNYIMHGNLFFSLKDVRIDFQQKEIESLNKVNENLTKNIKKVQKENDDLSNIIIKKLR